MLSGLPLISTHATPARETKAPIAAERPIDALKNIRPTNKVKIGPEAVISEILIALELISARYCKELKQVVLKNPVTAKSNQCFLVIAQSRLNCLNTNGNKISKATADELRAIEHEHNLVRDALFNRLSVLMRGRSGLLRALNLPETVHWNSDYGSTLHVGPLPNLLEVLSDPLYNLRAECQRVHGCGIHALTFPLELVGLSLYLEDIHVTGTEAHTLVDQELDESLNLLRDAERFTDCLTPISLKG